MLLRTKGIPNHINSPIVGRITRQAYDGGVDNVLIFEGNGALPITSNFAAIITNSVPDFFSGMAVVSSVQTVDHLTEGDIVALHPDGMVTTLYRVKSHQNFLLATERCNSNCLMCSQPPKNRDDTAYLFDIYRRLIPLIPKDCTELGITGGEPTLLGNLFFELLQLIQEKLPETEVHCLTNGRSFAWPQLAERLGVLNFRRLMLGIPLYSDHYKVHDYVVQSKHAFDQTMQGLYYLAAEGQRIEIRVVLHKITIPRLRQLAGFIYRNLPFVEHIAFMGLEFQGYTPHNIDKLWIDPVEYMDELGDAAEFLSARGMNVSIYNHQLCLLPETLWKFNRRSISDWKNVYLNECKSCRLVESCGGLFASGVNKHSASIRPF